MPCEPGCHALVQVRPPSTHTALEVSPHAGIKRASPAPRHPVGNAAHLLRHPDVDHVDRPPSLHHIGHPEKELPRVERIHIDSPIGNGCCVAQLLAGEVVGVQGYLRTSATNGTTNRTSATLTMTGQSFMTSP